MLSYLQLIKQWFVPRSQKSMQPIKTSNMTLFIPVGSSAKMSFSRYLKSRYYFSWDKLTIEKPCTGLRKKFLSSISSHGQHIFICVGSYSRCFEYSGTVRGSHQPFENAITILIFRSISCNRSATRSIQGFKESPLTCNC